MAIQKFKLTFLLVLFCGLVRAQSPQDSMAVVRLETSEGNMDVELFNDTPLHRDHFLKLVQQGFYDSLLFHIVFNHQFIESGNPKSKEAKSGAIIQSGDDGTTIPQEITQQHFNQKGALCAEFSPNNRSVNPKVTSGSLFYIAGGPPMEGTMLMKIEQRRAMANPNEHYQYDQAQINAYTTKGGLPIRDGHYTVYGQVISGLDILDRILNTPCDKRGRPLNDVRIMHASIIKKPKI